MKYCAKCGNELLDEALVCPKCGCAVEGVKNPVTAGNPSGLKTVANVFMIIGCVVGAMMAFLIPLAWCLPMTISYNRKIKQGEPVSVGFKVCCLLFVNVIAGILMLCDNEN